MSKRKILIDIDLTLVPSDLFWYEWLRGRYSQNIQQKERLAEDIRNSSVSYCLADYFNIGSEDRLLFWRQQDLYENMPLLPFAKDVIDSLYGEGNTIYFVSHSKASHMKSKYSLLQRNFPWVEDNKRVAFVATKNKDAVSGDVLIDDRICFIEGHNAKHKIQFNTPYLQFTRPTETYHKVSDWNEIGTLLKRLL